MAERKKTTIHAAADRNWLPNDHFLAQNLMLIFPLKNRLDVIIIALQLRMMTLLLNELRCESNFFFVAGTSLIFYKEI